MSPRCRRVAPHESIYLYRWRYINVLNRGQGLGVLFLRKRITYTLVMGLLIQTVSAMIVVNTTLMSIWHAENDVLHAENDVLHAENDEVAAIGNEEVVIGEALGKAG